MKNYSNVSKVIAFTALSFLVAAILEVMMMTQHGVGLMSGSIWARVLVMLVIAVVVVLLAVADFRASNYGTIFSALYYGIIDLGALLEVDSRLSVTGIVVQVLAVIGIIFCLIQVYYGMRQRDLYLRRKLGNQHRR